MPLSCKARLFWPLAIVLLLADCTTKELAVERLSPASVPHEILGDWLRLTLAYNQGAAMGLTLGPWSRLGFAVLAMAALVVLVYLYRQTAPTAAVRTAALALLIAGAAGNLLDRIRSPHGVIDFIDVGIGPLRFWTFNLADTWITLGALLLATVLWRVRRAEGAA